MKENPFPPHITLQKRTKKGQKTEKAKNSFSPFNPSLFTSLSLPTPSNQKRVQLTTCKHPQYRPHRSRMHHLLPTPSLLRLCRQRRPLPNHLLLLLRPNPNNPHLPRHRHQRSRLRLRLRLLPHPDHDFQPPNIRLRRHRHRRPTRANTTIDDMEKVYEYPHFDYSLWTTQSSPPLAIPMPILRFHQPLVSDCPAWKPERQHRPPLLCLRESPLL